MRKSFVLVCAFAIIFWSITFVNTRSLLSDFSALALIFICFGLALEFLGTGPKNLRVFAIFALRSGFAAVAALKRRGGCVAATFRWCGAAQEICFTSVRPRRKQKRRILFTFGMSCPRDHRKRQSERRATRSGIYRAKRSSSG